MKESNIIRVYADTSVFGGVYDDEFKDASESFFNAIVKEQFTLLVSEVVREELEEAPLNVKKVFEEMLPKAEIVEVSAEAISLQNAYLDEEIVTAKYLPDALHVALATVSNASMIVSWNFKHIVNYKKIPLYNAVNVLKGYGGISIYSPLEVIENED